jgi:exodeoxyribonuclease V beta subunit
MTEIMTLKDPQEVSLEHHGFIEASAGTGKTYLLEHLTVRILEEKGVELPEILLVTFTEKATGELKERIRKLLYKKMESAPDATGRDIYEKALLQFDNASISTIHGFCQKSLIQFALEARQDVRQDVTSDPLLYSTLLEKLMRDVWPDYFGPCLPELLIISGFPDPYKKNLEATILELAQKFHPESGDRLYPDFPDDYSPKDLLQDIHASLNRLLNIVGQINPNQPDASEFIKSYTKINFNGKTRNANISNVLLPVLKFLLRHTQKPVTFLEFHEVFSQFDIVKIQKLIPEKEKWTKNGLDYKSCLPNLPSFVEQLEKVLQQYWVLKNYLIIRSITLLQETARQHKEQKGLLSYDDMLQRLRDALRSSAGLVAQMQEKYKYALVDEFQDTDSVQWEIFRTLFTGKTQHRLFLIGDPKQAIYGFRGADIKTYLEAKDWMTANPDCRFYTQKINWRSTAPLIRGFNALFCGNEWFPPDSDIPVEKVFPSQENSMEKDSERPIKILELCPEQKATQARRKTARWIAREIKYLLKDPRIKPDDIFILIRKSTEAGPLEQELQNLDVSYEYYKKKGLFQSREAFHVTTLLKALYRIEDSPSRRAAMLSDFFRFPPALLVEAEEENPLFELFYEKMMGWKQLAETHQWARFFKDIQSEGTLYLTAARQEEQFPEIVPPRTRVNYQSILQILEHRTVSEDWSLEQLYQNMLKFQSSSTEEEEELSFYFPDSSGPRVKLMTIHMSKGLEAKVVFVAGGFTEGNKNLKYHHYYRDHHRVFDVTKSPEAKQAHNVEEDRENRRLYYVALTRCREKLYLPFFQMKGYQNQPIGPPVQKFIYESLEKEKKDSGWSPAFESHPGPDEQDLEDLDIEEKTDSPKTIDPTLPVPPQNLYVRNISIESFTRLWRTFQKFPDSAYEDESDLESFLLSDEGDSPAAIKAWNEAEKQLLPPGAQTGSMLHEVMEKIDLQHLMECADFSTLESQYPLAAAPVLNILQKFGFEPKDAAVVEKVIRLSHLAAKISIPCGAKSIALGTIPPEDRRAEMEFFLPLSGEELKAIKKVLPEDNRFFWSMENHLRGFIDLVFRIPLEEPGEYRYFVLDWKSNYLEEGYERQNLHEAMLEHGYHLQAGIYGAALCRWLRTIVPQFDFEKHFGGIYYVFLRGLSPDNPRQGVYNFLPEKEEEMKSDRILEYITKERGNRI